MKNSNKEKERFVVHNNFHSNILNNERDIIVWLPPSYEDSDKSYPVLYMHDGQNLFNNESSFSGSSWKVNKTVLKLIREKKLMN